MNLAELVGAFLERRGLERPDERPLYAYRCSDAEFESLSQALGGGGGLEQVATSSRGAAGFCLFVSEWWRRNYAGGPWAWEPILEAVGLGALTWPARHGAVERGLQYWRRELLRTGAQRAFLATLACEGGLPLNMLRREGAGLQRYFRAVLRGFREYRRSGASPTRLAEMERRYLPRSFRQDVVFTLAGELCEAVWEIQNQIGAVADPVAHLDRSDPEWRERIPLRIEDDTARALINNLVREASRLARVERADCKVVRSLVRGAEGWSFEAELRLPPQLGLRQMQEVFGRELLELPGRFEVLSTRSGGDREIQALATQVGSGDERRYYIEFPPGIEPVRRGPEAASGWGLLAAAGATAIGPIEPPGGSPLTELPWVFADKEGAGEHLELLGEGSLRTRHEAAFLAVAPGTEIEPADGSMVEEVGRCAELDRTLYRVRGEVVCADDEYGRCVVRTADRRETASEFKLSGDTAHLGGSSAVFRGPPSVWEYRPEAPPRRVAATAIEWRPLQTRAWRSWSEDCLGDVVIRVVEGGELRARLRASVLPRRFSFELRPQDERGGVVELDGLAGCLVGIEPHDGIRGDLEWLDQAARARVTAHADRVAPADLGIRLRWEEGCQVSVSVPFPARGTRFIGRDGQPLRNGQTVAATRLTGVTAVATQAGGGGHFTLDGELRASDVTPVLHAMLWLREPLRPAGRGRWTLDLRAVRDRLGELLKATSDRFASVRLAIEPSHGGVPTRLAVAPFDLVFERDEAIGVVRLASECEAGGSAALERFRVQAVPLWDHTAGREDLPRWGDSPYAWHFDPAGREPGPWLIMGLDSAWCRARPTLWNVEGGEHTAPETLRVEDIVRIADPERRSAAFDALFEELSADPADPRWSDALAYLKAFGDLPATTLDLVNCLIRHPEAVITALLNADEVTFERTFHLVDQTAFSWHLVPVACWTGASMRFAHVLRGQLEGVAGADDLVWGAARQLFELAPARGRFLEVIVEWLKFIVFRERNPSCPLLQAALVAQGRDHLRANLREEYLLLLQTHAHEEWPQAQEIGECLRLAGGLPCGLADLLIQEPEGTRFRLAVANAPLLAAIASLCALPVSPRMTQEIRSLRTFDERWFEAAHALALLIGIGQVFETDPEMLG